MVLQGHQTSNETAYQKDNKHMMIPVFIGGHPRSGTTLLGAMIGSHSECLCTPESQFKTRVLRHSSLKGQKGIDITKAFDLIRASWKYKIWGIHLNTAPLSGIESYRDLLEFIVTAYGKKIGKFHTTIWVDHTPANLKNATVLCELFPSAKFIHIVRDGRAVASSIMPLDWGANTINSAALSWVKRMSQYLAVESQLGDDKILRIKFEDLVLSPEPILKKICGFLNLDYQSGMIEGTGFRVPSYQNEIHSQVGKGIDVTQVNAWEAELTARQIEIFESIAEDMLLSFGYQLKFRKQAKRIMVKEKVMMKIEETAKALLINRIRHGLRIRRGIREASKQR
jgi:hypothetical protein